MAHGHARADRRNPQSVGKASRELLRWSAHQRPQRGHRGNQEPAAGRPIVIRRLRFSPLSSNPWANRMRGVVPHGHARFASGQASPPRLVRLSSPIRAMRVNSSSKDQSPPGPFRCNGPDQQVGAPETVAHTDRSLDPRFDALAGLRTGIKDGQGGEDSLQASERTERRLGPRQTPLAPGALARVSSGAWSGARRPVEVAERLCGGGRRFLAIPSLR
jgi:hypothetical protein